MSHYNNPYPHERQATANPYVSTNSGTTASLSNHPGMNNHPTRTATVLPQAPQPMNVDESAQVQDLKDQLATLRRELMMQSESNFELNATIATMQAEMTHTIKSSEAKYKEEASKLNHLLRLEQQRSQRLEQQQHKQQQQIQYQLQQRQLEEEEEEQADNMHPRKKVPSSSSAQHYSNRFSGGVPQTIVTTTTTNNNNTSNHRTSSSQPIHDTTRASSSTPEFTGTLVTPKSEKSSKNASHTGSRNEGARRLAKHLLQEEKSTSMNDTVRQVLVNIAGENDSFWTQVKLVEFLIRHASMELWYPALLTSQPGRRGIVMAIEQSSSLSTTTTTTSKPKAVKKSRITFLGPSIGIGIYPQQEQQILHAIQDPWWVPSSTGSTNDNTLLSKKEKSLIPSDLVIEWVKRLPDGLVHPKLQALNVLLEECNNNNNNDVWWNLLYTKMEVVMEQIYERWIKASPLKAAKSKAVSNSKTTVTQQQQKRRLEMAVTNERSVPQMDGVTPKELIATSLSIWCHLLKLTSITTLTSWYKEGKGAKMVSLVLDLLEEQAVTRKKTANKILGGWYLDTIASLTTVGSTRAGFDLLRTRSRPAGAESGDCWMDNTIDVAIRQLFSLVMDQEKEEPGLRKSSTQSVAIDGWICLLNQVLLYVQQQQQPDKQPVALSFRSLILDYQNWYTSACAMLLANAKTRPEIQSIIRIQLEELSMDEEEYEELKG